MNSVRIITLNLWAKHGPWPARAAAIRAGLAAEQPDVVALQEVLAGPLDHNQLDDQLDDLFAPGELSAEHYPGRAYAPACVLADRRTFGNALLSRFPILDKRIAPLPNPRGREPRALLCALIDLGGPLLPVFVTHLDWELDGSYARCQQVLFIADQIESWVAAARARPGADVLPPVLAADLNAEPASDEIRFLSGHHALSAPGEPTPRCVYFNDCYARARVRPHANDDDAGATFARSNPYAARAREPDRRLDYIFAGLPDARGRGEPLRAWRCFRTPHQKSSDPKADAVFASDHYGVAVDLALA